MSDTKNESQSIDYNKQITEDIIKYHKKYTIDGKVGKVNFSIPEHKTIALVAHDGMKDDMIEWCDENKDILQNHFLCGTGTTAGLITKKTGLPVRAFKSGPLGGDQQIGSRITETKINILIFFSDPLTAQPHDTDVKALMRIAQLYNIPMAINRATADFILNSCYMNDLYKNCVTPFIDRRNSNR